jgi:hypothetical protein
MDSVAVAQSPSQSTTGNFWNDAVDNLLKVVTGGAQVYATINNKTQGAAAQVAAQQVSAAPATVAPKDDKTVVFGLTQNQVLLVAGGLTVLLIVSMLRRR